jgi:PEP-CTERM motif
VYAGATEAQPVSVLAAEAGAQLPFLAATCPQVEGKAVAGSSERCTATVNTVPEPSTWALVVLAGGLMGALVRRQRQGVPTR